MSRIDKSADRIEIEAVLGLDRGASARRSWRRRIGLVVLALLAVGAGAIWLDRGSQPAVRFIAEPVTRGNLTVVVTATGSVQPTNKVDVSSELSGTVRRVLVDYNSPVTVGQALAELDTDKLNAVVESSRARLAATKARVAEAEATMAEKAQDLARKRTLAERHVVSAHDLEIAHATHERAVAALAAAHADVAVAQADLKLNETNLSKACICSPIDGIVLRRNVDPGQTVASSFQAPVLFSIAEDLRQMELQVDVDEADVGQVRIGQSATFSVDAYPNRRFPAMIRDLRFASETVQGVVTYKAVLSIDNSELLLRPGMTATAEINVLDVTDVMLAPNTALRFTPPASQSNADGRSWLRRVLPGPPHFRAPSQHEESGPERTVWVLRNGQPAAVKVIAGASDGKRTQIESSEIEAGALLIVDSIAAKQ